MSTLTKIDVMSWAKFQAIFAMIVMAVVGIIQVVLLSSLSSVFKSMGGVVEGANVGGALAGIGFVGVLIGIPVAGAAGFVGGLVGGWLCNVVLKWVGGLKFELHHG